MSQIVGIGSSFFVCVKYGRFIFKYYQRVTVLSLKMITRTDFKMLGHRSLHAGTIYMCRNLIL